MKTKLIFALALQILLFTGCEKDDDALDQSTNSLVADAGTIDGEVVLGELLTLDGSESKDDAGNTFTYVWTVKNKPQGSVAVLEDETTATPEITPDVEGDYTIELKISNSRFSDTDEISFTATSSQDQEALIINANITQNRQLPNVYTDPELVDYLVTNDIHVSALLQIDPGVKIAFETDKAMYIDNPGAIIGVATPNTPIIFTRKTNSTGFWKGLVINSGSPMNKLDNVVIEYGGSSVASGMEKAANLAVTKEGQGNITLSRTFVRYSNTYGMVAESGSNITVEAGVVFSNNQKPLQVPASQVKGIHPNTEFSINELNKIEVTGDKITGSEESWWNIFEESPYLVSGKIEVASGWRILPGTEILMDENAEIQIIGNGYLSAIGTEDSPIQFMGAQPFAGYWKGIAFWNHHLLNKIQYAVISGGGSEVMGENLYTAAVSISGVDGAKLNLSESKIAKSGDYGLYVGPTSELSNFKFNVFDNNEGAAIAVPANEVAKFRTHTAISFLNNGHNGVEIYPSTLRKMDNSESVWGDLGFGATYLIGGNIAVNTGLKILPGTVLKFKENAVLGVFQNGYLDAEGLPDQKITFTGASETKGFWNGILVRSSSPKNKLIYTEVLYAGKTPLPGPAMVGSIALDPNYSPRMTIKNSRIAYGLGFGIVMDSNRTTVNEDVESTNQFVDLSLGNIFR